MSDKVIIELELLTPIKYEEVFWKDMVSQPVVYEIGKPRIFRNRLTNIAFTKENGDWRSNRKIERQEDYEGFERIYYFKSGDQSRIEYPEKYELRGLSKEEHIKDCNLYYKILNFPAEGLKTLRGENERIKCYVKPTHLDIKTIDTFKDMFDEL